MFVYEVYCARHFPCDKIRKLQQKVRLLDVKDCRCDFNDRLYYTNLRIRDRLCTPCLINNPSFI